MLLNSCADKKSDLDYLQHSESDEYLLWEDRTSDYLPVTGEWTNRVELADINNDGWIDLLFANGGNYSRPGTLEYSRVFLNKGPDDLFEEATLSVFGDNKFISRVIKVRDLNSDGIPDIVLATTYESQSQLYMGLGEGRFKNVTSTHLPQILASIGDVEFGDVDDDGDLDMILADWGPGSNMTNSGGRTMLWLNDGAGYFSNVTESQMPELLIRFSWDLEFIDFDNDFDLDIAVSCKRCPTSRMFVNNGKGFYDEKRLLPAYTNNYDFEVMDLNKDGFMDMVTINDGDIVDGENSSRKEHIFLNDGGKRFIDATDLMWPDESNVGKDDNNISFLDYDSDGDADFLISSLTGEDRLLINDGDGHFSLMQPIMSGKPTPLTLSMVLGDLNKDKRLDIVMGQGEGDKDIDERIYLGKNIKPDTSAPIIMGIEISDDSGSGLKLKARIHDNKSPNMPHDWERVVLISSIQDTIDMYWYGEYLWAAPFSGYSADQNYIICATDYCGNERCVDVE